MKREEKIKKLHDDWDKRLSYSNGDGFYDHLVKTICRADDFNIMKLHLVYPDMIDEYVAYAFGVEYETFFERIMNVDF